MFAIDCVLCRKVSQLFACVLVPCVSNWCEETVTVICPEVAMFNGPVLIWWMKYMNVYRICMGITHCATLWMTAEFWKKERKRKWCKLLKKSENSKSVINHNDCCPVTDVFFCVKTRITTKQHVENISQMYDKNSWGFCQRSNQKNTRWAHPFEGARYWLGCSRSTLPCHLSERLHSRGWQTPGNHQRH